MIRRNQGEAAMANHETITRRAALTATAASVAALGSSEASAQSQTRKTFVLIHGAYHGGWCWKKVTDILERGGHKVYAPSLTGLADRSHLLSMSVDLDTHIADIVNLFKWEDIKDACLVPHSYGGWPVSGALEQIADRVSSIVFLDAFMPKDGERSSDQISEFSRKALAEAMAKGEPGRQPPKANQYSISEKDYDWMNSKLTAQPNGPVPQPIKLTGALQKVAKKTFVRAPKYPQALFDRALAECKADPTWTTYIVENSHHDVMIDAPEWLVGILLKHS
jgi:pimeloyl-ACP methyl ester carboxylesterase